MKPIAIFSLLSVSIAGADDLDQALKAYYEAAESIVSESDTVAIPSTLSKSVQSNLAGRWQSVTPPRSLSPAVQITEIEFLDDGTARYRIKGIKGGEESFKSPFQMLQKGGAEKLHGKLPSVLLGTDGHLFPLIDVKVDYDSRFPMKLGRLLKFKDIEGNQFFFKRDPADPGRDVAEDGEAAAENSAGVAEVVKFRSSNTRETGALVDALRQRDLSEQERQKIILKLGNVGDETSVPALVELLDPKQKLSVRQNAIRALGKIGSAQAVLPLLSILQTTNPSNDEGDSEAILKRNTVIALREIGDPSALEALRKVSADSHEYKSVRDLAIEAIHSIGSKGPSK